MSPDREHEHRGYLSNMNASSRCVSADPMGGGRETAPLTRTMFRRGNCASDPSLRTPFDVACGLHCFEPSSR